MKLTNFPDNIINHYNLQEKVTDNGYVYVTINQGMYGLPQSGILAQHLLEKGLNDRGYWQINHTPGLWTNKTRRICFTLVVDDFGVKYSGK